MLARSLFTEEHEMFRAQVRRFVEKEVVPHHDQWEKDGIVSRDVWRAAGNWFPASPCSAAGCRRNTAGPAVISCTRRS